MDFKSLLANAEQLQAKVKSAQDSLANMSVKGIAGNGSVIVELTGKYDFVNITIRDEILSTGSENVSKLVADAYKDAKSKADNLIEKVMTDATGDISLPK